MEDFRGFLLNISKMVQLIFTKLMSFLGNYVWYLTKLRIEDRSFIAMVTNSWGSAALKIIIKEKKSGIFLKILC